MDLARRSFLRGRAKTPLPFRPPWVQDEAAFASACTRCGDCLSACPTGLLQKGGGGFPIAAFEHGHCTFCGDCSRACQPHAIAADTTLPAWNLVATIGENCLTIKNVVCRTCGELCEAGAIRFFPRVGQVALPVIDSERCTGCGECVGPCPSAAIRIGRPTA